MRETPRMDTDLLIARLAAETRPVPRNALQLRLLTHLAAGLGAALLLLLLALGTRSDLPAATTTLIFWLKAAYTFSLGGIGAFLVVQLARPDADIVKGWWYPVVPVAIMIALAINEGMRGGQSAEALIAAPGWVCAPLILMLAVPLFAALVLALRSWAPTRLRLAGAAAGLAAGGLAATVYGLYCQQVSPSYILTRYTVVIALCGVLGAAAGKRLLRW